MLVLGTRAIGTTEWALCISRRGRELLVSKTRVQSNVQCITRTPRATGLAACLRDTGFCRHGLSDIEFTRASEFGRRLVAGASGCCRSSSFRRRPRIDTRYPTMSRIDSLESSYLQSESIFNQRSATIKPVRMKTGGTLGRRCEFRKSSQRCTLAKLRAKKMMGWSRHSGLEHTSRGSCGDGGP